MTENKLELCLYFFIILLNLADRGLSKKDFSVIETKYGKIEGTQDKSAWTQRSFYEFRGVPYAVAPVGELRFEVLKHILIMTWI